VLAGEFLKNAEEVLEQGVHPTVIASGYRLASVNAKEILKTLAKTVTLKDKDLLLKIAVTAITGKGTEASKDVFASLAVTIPLVSIRSIHQCLISALLPCYLFVVGILLSLFTRSLSLTFSIGSPSISVNSSSFVFSELYGSFVSSSRYISYFRFLGSNF
jgi:hypothetical protein